MIVVLETSFMLEEKFVKWSPAIFIGYNSINFDEEFLRNSLFKTLLDPYLTSRNNNNRGDLLELLRTVEFFFPDTINVPLNNKNKKTFKLDQIAPANSINHFAHDAFGDVTATKQLAQLIFKRKPSFWQSFLNGSNKSMVYKFLSEEKMVFFCQTFFSKYWIYKNVLHFTFFIKSYKTQCGIHILNSNNTIIF